MERKIGKYFAVVCDGVNYIYPLKSETVEEAKKELKELIIKDKEIYKISLFENMEGDTYFEFMKWSLWDGHGKYWNKPREEIEFEDYKPVNPDKYTYLTDPPRFLIETGWECIPKYEFGSFYEEKIK